MQDLASEAAGAESEAQDEIAPLWPSLRAAGRKQGKLMRLLLSSTAALLLGPCQVLWSEMLQSLGGTSIGFM